MTIAISPTTSPNKAVACTGLMAILVVGMTILQSNKLQSLRAVDNSLDPIALQQASQLRANQLGMLKKAPKFGFNNIVANVALIDFMGYFGNQKIRDIDGYSLGFDYFEVILKQDPKFFLSYYFLSATGSSYLADPSRSISIMNEGFQSIKPTSPKNSYYLWRLKAIDELLFLGDAPAAQLSMETAANWAEQIGDEEAMRVAENSQDFAGYLAKNPASKQARFRSWVGILNTAIDNSARKLAVTKIRELGGKVELDANRKIKITPPATD
jgi:hypothetical protein